MIADQFWHVTAAQFWQLLASLLLAEILLMRRRYGRVTRELEKQKRLYAWMETLLTRERDATKADRDVWKIRTQKLLRWTHALGLWKDTPP